jgi:uncharacterized RDD family membrane protein YckC
MSTLWFYAERGEQRGPVAEEELRRRFLRSELPHETLVWSEGMAGWAPAVRVTSLMKEPPPTPTPPALAATAAASAQGAAVAVAPPTSRMSAMPREAARQALLVHRPWARFGARIIDLVLFQIVVLLFLPATVLPDPENSMAVNIFFIAFSIGTLIGWTFFEAAFLSLFGMTPGKWMYRVRIMHPEGRFLRYGEALSRSFQVLLQGLAAGLPGVWLITMALAYKELMETGSTAWDRRGRTTVQHAVPKGIHNAAVFAVFGLLLYGAFKALATVS